MSAERSYKTRAIVLRARNLGEADKIFTLLTSEHGKTDAVAKGVRRGKNGASGRLAFGSEVFLMLNRGRSLDVIVSAEALQSRWSSLVEPLAYATAHVMVELVDAFCEPAQALPEVYELLNAALRALEHAADPSALIPRFQVRLLAVLGLAPYDEACVRCGEMLHERGAWGDLDAGGLACESCRPHAADLLPLEAHEVVNFRSLAAPRVGGGRAPAVTAAPAVARAIEAFVTHHLGKRVKASRLLEELRSPGHRSLQAGEAVTG